MKHKNIGAIAEILSRSYSITDAEKMLSFLSKDFDMIDIKNASPFQSLAVILLERHSIERIMTERLNNLSNDMSVFNKILEFGNRAISLKHSKKEMTVH